MRDRFPQPVPTQIRTQLFRASPIAKTHPPRRRQSPHHGRCRRQDRHTARSVRRSHRQTTAGGRARARTHRPSHEQGPGVRHRHRRGRHGRQTHARADSLLPSPGPRTLHGRHRGPARRRHPHHLQRGRARTRPASRWKRWWAPPSPPSPSTTCARLCRTTSKSDPHACSVKPAASVTFNATHGRRNERPAYQWPGARRRPQLAHAARQGRPRVPHRPRRSSTGDEAAGRSLSRAYRRRCAPINRTTLPARGTPASSIGARSKAPSPESVLRNSPVLQTLPGWWSPATCRSSMRRRCEHSAARARPQFRRHCLSQVQPRRLARAALRHLGAQCATRNRRANGRRPQLPAQIPASTPTTLLLDQPDPESARQREHRGRLLNAPCAEFGHARSHPAARTIRVQYFALLREQAGRSDETVTTRARDSARALCRAARALSVHAAAGDAARGDQCGVRRMVAAARKPATPWSSFRRWQADEPVSLQHELRSTPLPCSAELRDDALRRLRVVRRMGAQPQRRPRRHAPGIRSVRGARGKGRRDASSKKPCARFGVTPRRLRAPRGLARRSRTSPYGWA